MQLSRVWDCRAIRLARGELVGLLAPTNVLALMEAHQTAAAERRNWPTTSGREIGATKQQFTAGISWDQ